MRRPTMENNSVPMVTLPLSEYVDTKIENERYKRMFRIERPWSDRLTMSANASDVYWIAQELLHEYPDADKYEISNITSRSSMSIDIGTLIK